MPDTASEITYRWSREAYDRAVEAGVFGPDDRLELIEGQLLAMTPQGSRHAAIVDQAGEILRAAFGGGFRIRVQSPLAVGDARACPGAAIAVADLLPSSHSRSGGRQSVG